MNAGIRVLCVDDEEDVLMSMKQILMDTGYEIITASSGEEGLSVLSQLHTIQVVISDYRMPGMNGIEFLRKAREQWPEAVCLILSGIADNASITPAIQEGEIYKFIPKPLSDYCLRVTIANAVDRYFLLKKNSELAIELKNKNEELQIINESLEKKVGARNEELIFQNLVLRKSQNILESLPIAVIGLDLEGQVVWHNKKGMDLFNKATLGLDMHSVFSPEVCSFIDRVIENGSLSDKITVSGRLMRVIGSVMSHEDGQSGVVILLEEY